MLPLNLEVGMMSVPASFRAVVLANHAYSDKEVRVPARAQVVVILTGVLPLVVPVGANGKVTAAVGTVTVRDSASVAVSATVDAPEFNCAFEAGVYIKLNATAAIPNHVCFLINRIVPPGNLLENLGSF